MAVLPNHRNHGGGSLSELVLILLYFRNVPIEANHYYPWGGLMAVSTGGDAQRYKFSGKELIRDHGIDWYDHGARWYDATAPTWHTMDPLCEKYYSISPYAYCAGNPIRFVDPDGKIKIEVFNTQVKNIETELLVQNAINYPDDGTAIHIYGHGDIDKINAYLMYGNTPMEITNADDIFKYTSVNVPLLSSDPDLGEKMVALINQNINNPNTVYDTNSEMRIVLHACMTGANKYDSSGCLQEESFASILSRKLPNSTIIAPDKDIVVKEGLIYGTNEYVENGSWIQFENGEAVDSYTGTRYPYANTPFSFNP